MINIFFEEHQRVFSAVREQLPLQIEAAAQAIVQTVKQGGTIFFAGNGGSAADAQHLAAEFTGRFVTERKPLPAIALTTDTSALTAIGNDYGFEVVFARQLEALARPGDLFVGITCSGGSPNIICALKTAAQKGVATIGLLGRDGGKAKSLCTHPIIVPDQITARIQEMHIFIGHIFCSYLDAAFPVESQTP